MTVTPRPYYFRSRNVESVTPELGRILEKHPPPGDNCSVIVHHAHGAALKANPDASFAVRSPHLVLGFGAALPRQTCPRIPSCRLSRSGPMLSPRPFPRLGCPSSAGT